MNCTCATVGSAKQAVHSVQGVDANSGQNFAREHFTPKFGKHFETDYSVRSNDLGEYVFALKDHDDIAK